MDVDFSSQDYFRNPAAAITKLQSAGPVVEVRFPILGRIWTTTTAEMADRVLKDSGTFSMRRDDGNIAGVRWWMPGIATLEMEPRILAIADELADRLFAQGKRAPAAARGDLRAARPAAC